MQSRTRVDQDGRVTVEVIDPSDGAVIHAAAPALGEQVVVTALTARSPADIKWSGCENIPAEPDETVELGERASGPVEGGPGVPSEETPDEPDDEPEDQAA